MKSFKEQFEDLFDLEDNLDKYEWIIEYGAQHEGLAADYCIDANLVKGCTSPLWLAKEDGRLRAYGESSIVNGLACMICDWYNQALPEQQTVFSINDFTDLGLMPILSMGRQNGVANLIARIKKYE